MKTLFPLLLIGAISIFVLFAPPAASVFKQHPECSISGFSPDLTVNQRAFCREWRKK
jgi:hypothetical protein